MVKRKDKKQKTSFLERLGFRLKVARLDSDLTQAELAAHLGLTRGSIAKIEEGATNVPIFRLKAICDVLDKDILDLFQEVADA